MNDKIFLGFCDGWDIPMHEADTVTRVQKPYGTELDLCDRCLVEYRKDFPRINHIKDSLKEIRDSVT